MKLSCPMVLNLNPRIRHGKLTTHLNNVECNGKHLVNFHSKYS
jgi:hypothetical protein